MYGVIMAMGEGGPELVKQLLNKTYDINMPGVVAIYMTGEPMKGVGPQDVALAIIGEVFANGYVKNKVMEFVGPGVSNLSADFRIGVDVMTTETTCLSSIWRTDEKIKEFYDIHGRSESYKELNPGSVAYYDGVVYVDLSKIKPMIAMPFHPSNTYTIDELNANLEDILRDVEKKALVSLDGQVDFKLTNKIKDGRLYVDQGIIAGCAGGGFENICAAADILRGHSIGADEFTLSVYPASTPIYMELARNGRLADLMETGAIVKTAFCGPCFGAGDTPANNAFSIRHSTRNFPNREGSKLQNGQISSVALMDARSIAATAANKGFLTAATDCDVEFTGPTYHFDSAIYANRVFDSKGVADPEQEIQFGPNIKDWPEMVALPENLIIKVVSEIHDPVTTTDELIPSGETSSYRSNPLGLAEFALSRKDPAYVGRAKEVQKAEKAREDDELIEVKLTNNKKDIFLVTKYGQCIRFPETDVRSMGRTAMGVIGMQLNDGDEVIGMQLNTQGDHLLIVSANGMGKLTSIDEFKSQNRGGKGVKCYKIMEKTGNVIGVKNLHMDDEIMMINTEGIVIRMMCSDISVLGRVTSGVKLMNLSENVSVASIAKVRETSADSEDIIKKIEDEMIEDEKNDEEIKNEETTQEPPRPPVQTLPASP